MQSYTYLNLTLLYVPLMRHLYHRRYDYGIDFPRQGAPWGGEQVNYLISPN
jgi:hypothetical protein